MNGQTWSAAAADDSSSSTTSNGRLLGLLVALFGLPTGVAGCQGADASLDEFAVVHPAVDDTPPGASFGPGQLRDVGDADLILTLPGIEGDEIADEVAGVDMPGDLDGDGIDDLVAWSMPHADPDIVDCSQGCPAFRRLVLRILYGRADGPLTALDATPRIVGPWINGLVTWVASAGDLDGDGDTELLVSVGGDCQQRSVYTLRGGTRLTGTIDLRDAGELLREDGACTGFGHGTGVGDLNGDGRDDFAVAQLAVNRAFLFFGQAASPERRSEDHADLSLGDQVGMARPAGDVNGDGVPDLLLGPSVESLQVSGAPSGRWRLLFGRRDSEGAGFAADEVLIPGALLVTALGDLDGDGRDELGVSDGEGVTVVVGRAEWPSVLGPEQRVLHLSRSPDPGLGSWALRRVGDVNGDGYIDLGFTDSEAFSEDLPRGVLRVFLGPIDLTAEKLRAEESAALLGRIFRDGRLYSSGYDALGAWGWRLGMGFAGGSDLDDDGYDDFVVIGRYANGLSGYLYLWRGRP